MTVNPSKRFRYPLEPLLAKHGWEVDTLRLELYRARQILETRRRELGTITAEAAGVLKSAAELAAEGRVIDLSRRQMLADYLVHLEDQVAAKEAEVNQAQTVCDDVLGHLDQALRSFKGIESHRDQMGSVHREAVAKLEFAEADEAWLLRPRILGEGT